MSGDNVVPLFGKGVTVKAEQKPLPPLYVRVRHDVFQDVLKTLAMYGEGLSDGGAAAAEVMDRVFAK